MSNESDDLCFCPLEEVMSVIGKKWTLLIINGIGIHGRIRFNRLMEELHNISPKTLSERLKELQTEGLIKREAFAEIPPRVEYSLTKDGIELRKSIIPIYEWAIDRIVTSGRTIHCECEKCKSLLKSQTLSRTKRPTDLE
jgi:DNA-binding HxlR family transcriptional regulator